MRIRFPTFYIELLHQLNLNVVGTMEKTKA